MRSPLEDPKLLTKAIDQFIGNPSLGALNYQACYLLEILESLSDAEYPSETCHIRDVLLSWAEYIRDELWDLYDENDPLGIKPGGDFKRVRGLGKLLHQIHSSLRYLLATSADKSPAALQAATSELTRLHFPKENGEHVCVVRPQWKYNLKYVALSDELREAAPLTLIDPSNQLGLEDEFELPNALWKRRRDKLPLSARERLPELPARHLAIVSFPGLDKRDSLLYPLVSHELGHLIDFSFRPPLHNSASLVKTSIIGKSKVQTVLESFYGKLDEKLMARRLGVAWSLVTECTLVCLRELLADLLATRMMGLSFFISQAEFLKSVGDWEMHFIEGQPLIDLKSGYPNIKLRLSVIYNHLLQDEADGNLMGFIDEELTEKPELKAFLSGYITSWKLILKNPKTLLAQGLKGSKKSIREGLSRLVEVAIFGSLDELDNLARARVIDKNRATLTANFLQRIESFCANKPPICENEDPNRFSEIMSAAWVYQMFYGEWKEIANKNIEDQRREYDRTCQLINDALEHF